jgi:hypothetical protein
MRRARGKGHEGKDGPEAVDRARWRDRVRAVGISCWRCFHACRVLWTASDSRPAGLSGTEGETRIASARAGDGPVLWDNGSGGSLGRLAAEGRVCGKGLFRQGTCRRAGLPVVDRDHARGSEIQAGEEPGELRPGPQLHDYG